MVAALNSQKMTTLCKFPIEIALYSNKPANAVSV